MLSAHPITMALSKNSAQSANSRAAPRFLRPPWLAVVRRMRLTSDFRLLDNIDIAQYGVRLSGMIASHGTAASARPKVILISPGN